MAFKHGKKAVLKVDNSGGVLTDITAYTTRVGLPQTADVAEVSALGATSKSYVAGLKDGRLPFDGKFDPTLHSHLTGILGQDATVSFEYGPQGSGAGSPKGTGEAILISYEPNTSLDDAGTYTAELQVSGDVTWGVYP